MPWILLLLAALWISPLSAASLPGIPAATTDKSTASEPDLEQKKAAWAALADVLDNPQSRQELIDELRKAAATQPPAAAPTLTPPEVKDEQTVLESVTELAASIASACRHGFRSYGAISPARRISLSMPMLFAMPLATSCCWPGWYLPSGG